MLSSGEHPGQQRRRTNQRPQAQQPRHHRCPLLLPRLLPRQLSEAPRMLRDTHPAELAPPPRLEAPPIRAAPNARPNRQGWNRLQPARRARLRLTSSVTVAARSALPAASSSRLIAPTSARHVFSARVPYRSRHSTGASAAGACSPNTRASR
eukprot:scaffold3183_cov120-Isochrysis_galbana.AAC.11